MMIDITRKFAVFCTSDWLPLAATPIFALMAVVTGILDSGAYQICSPAEIRMSPLAGMAPMYALMCAFHVTPWLRLISAERRGGGVEARDPSTQRFNRQR
jgi:hypothetical protein